MRKEVRAVVDPSLRDLSSRQAEREERRETENQLRECLRLRREGVFNSPHEAKVALGFLGVTWVEEMIYGMRIIATSAGMRLAYRRDGELDYVSGPNREPDGTVQMDLLEGEEGVRYACDESCQCSLCKRARWEAACAAPTERKTASSPVSQTLPFGPPTGQ